MRTAAWRRAAAVGAAGLLALGLLGLYLRQRPAGRGPGISPGVSLELHQVTARGRAGGNREWRLKARRVQVSRDRTVTRLFDIREAVLQAGEVAELHLRAPQARLNTLTGNLEVAGPVRIAGEGWRLRAGGLRWLAGVERGVALGPLTVYLGDTVIRTDKAYYLAGPRVIACPQGVRISGPDGDLSGRRLTVDLEREEYVLEGGVTMRLSMAGAEQTLASGRAPGSLDRLGRALWGRNRKR